MPELAQKGRSLRGPPLFILASGGAAARVLPGALKRGLGRGPDGPRRVFKDVPAQRRSQLSWGRVGGSASQSFSVIRGSLVIRGSYPFGLINS